MARFVQLYEPFSFPSALGPHSYPAPVLVNVDAVEFMVASESRRNCTDIHIRTGEVLTVQGVVGGNARALRQGPLSRRWDGSRASYRFRVVRDRIATHNPWSRDRRVTLPSHVLDERHRDSEAG